jgi:tRNA pseudouridine55 synthase
MQKKSDNQQPISGFMLVNKPCGPTSHTVVNQLRRITGVKKIGHAGTLDPFASGLLIMAIGREATRQINKYVKMEKEYLATLKLGAMSDTYDRTGEISYKVESEKWKVLGRDEIEIALDKFRGRQEQVPPMFSAKKIQGKRLYELARRGVEVEREPAEIEIKELSIIKYDYPKLVIRVVCSSGTYVRSLAHDIGQTLGCGAYLEELERTAIGKYKLSRAIKLNDIDEANWMDWLFV